MIEMEIIPRTYNLFGLTDLEIDMIASGLQLVKAGIYQNTESVDQGMLQGVRNEEESNKLFEQNAEHMAILDKLIKQINGK